MKLTNCTWELDNLGCRVAEIDCSDNHELLQSQLDEIEKKFDYIVVKAPLMQPQLNVLLGRNKYACIEAQLSIRIKISELEERLWMLEGMGEVHTMLVDNEQDLNQLLDKMTESMFTSDRIYLDPNFGPTYSLNRYRNWIKSEYLRGTQVFKIYANGDWVGFFMPKESGMVLHGLLGGLFDKYQGEGLGIVLPLMPLLINSNARKYETKISSNNFPVVQLYNQCEYSFTNVEYVFVKHINQK